MMADKFMRWFAAFLLFSSGFFLSSMIANLPTKNAVHMGFFACATAGMAVLGASILFSEEMDKVFSRLPPLPRWSISLDPSTKMAIGGFRAIIDFWFTLAGTPIVALMGYVMFQNADQTYDSFVGGTLMACAVLAAVSGLVRFFAVVCRRSAQQ